MGQESLILCEAGVDIAQICETEVLSTARRRVFKETCPLSGGGGAGLQEKFFRDALAKGLKYQRRHDGAALQFAHDVGVLANRYCTGTHQNKKSSLCKGFYSYINTRRDVQQQPRMNPENESLSQPTSCSIRSMSLDPKRQDK